MERKVYFAIELSFPEEDDPTEVLEELDEHLKECGYDYYLTFNPYAEQITTLLINEDQTGYIDTILQDRNIEYEYET